MRKKTQERLIPPMETTDTKTLEDYWYMVARLIEGSLVEAGAIPVTDYSRLDLYKLAAPIVELAMQCGSLKVEPNQQD